MAISYAEIGSPFKMAIDYTGGTIWEMAFDQPVDTLAVRDVFINDGYTNTTAQSVEGANIVLVRTKDISVEEKQVLISDIQSTIGQFEERRYQTIGPTIGREVTRASGVAVLVASLAILAFIWYVFRMVNNPLRFGVSAIVARLHDVLVTAGLFSLAG